MEAAGSPNDAVPLGARSSCGLSAVSPHDVRGHVQLIRNIMSGCYDCRTQRPGERRHFATLKVRAILLLIES
jgi:hypothetical protein